MVLRRDAPPTNGRTAESVDATKNTLSVKLYYVMIPPIRGTTAIPSIAHSTAIVAGGLVWPATVSVTGTASPVAIPDGTTAFTWYNPA